MQRHWLVGLFLGIGALTSGSVAAQTPIHGFNRTIALPANVDRFYSDVNKLLVWADGFIGGPETEVDNESAPLETLEAGTPVVVHYTVAGVPASPRDAANRGIVTAVRGKDVTIRMAGGATKTLRYTSDGPERSDSGVRHGDRVVVYSLDDSGRGTVRYFKPGVR
jgi:hypothetical protein